MNGLVSKEAQRPVTKKYVEELALIPASYLEKANVPGPFWQVLIAIPYEFWGSGCLMRSYQIFLTKPHGQIMVRLTIQPCHLKLKEYYEVDLERQYTGKDYPFDQLVSMNESYQATVKVLR